MSKGNEPAFPAGAPPVPDKLAGLTKRELFAAMAMQAVMSDMNAWMERGKGDLPQRIARMAVSAADALIAELEKGS